ncbi:MAG TPA: proline dehydrogenase [Actinobacteria bacterium]|nr:proline dehydrogenase [Actinomycetota bacterium]
MKTAATSTPLTKSVARRFVAGESAVDAVQAGADLAASGLHCTIEYLGPEVIDEESAEGAVKEYLKLLEALQAADLLDRSELSVKPSDMGLELDGGSSIALANTCTLAGAAAEFDTLLTLDMEAYSTVEPTFELFDAVHADFPQTGIVVQSYLKRTEDDCRRLADSGARVRLVKGAFDEPEEVAFEAAQDIDLSYVRSLKALMNGDGIPLIATHDPRLIEIAAALAVRTGRERSSYEFQMLFGVRPDEQKRLAASGEKVRVYVPYGPQWYPYLVRRMAEKPANLALFARALAGRG